ncbi:uncharacterized protein LOC110249911 [Exaiptasia diaphana]|uniref:Uncharacterized protein n=1 Tax=Exaiptasia diaphana TaxID=2652724 RepID=A0A913XZD1_EXADI|nr:uncharacterized protein LOC110249911 [Exaiptasia diaphana]
MASGLGSKLFKDEYRNWRAVDHAFDLMNEGIRPFITREMKAIYNTLMGLGRPPCTCRYKKSRKNNPWHDMRVCDWAKALQLYHGSNKPKWHQSDASNWTDPLSGSWEIAKLFMSDLGKQKAVVVDASSTDTTGLLNIFCWCKNFAPLRRFAERVRDVRNIKWGHNSKFELSLREKNDAIRTIEQLLNAGALHADPDAQKALNSINTMNSHFDAQKLERQIIRDYMTEVTNELNSVQSELTELDTKQKKHKKTMKGIKRRIKNQTECMKSLKALRNIGYVSTFVATVFRTMNSIRKKAKMVLWLFMLFLFVVQFDPSSNSLERCPSEDRPLPFNLRDVSTQLNAARKDFVGRRWFYDDVKNLLESLDPPVLLIIGEPGSGKSAIAANLICSRTSEAAIHENIIAYHLCQHYSKETQEPGKFIKNTVHMISRRSREYENVILNGTLMKVLQGRKCESDPYKCFIEAIVDPLKRAFKNPSKFYYIVIDALDECIPHQSQHVTIIDLLKDKVNEFPKSIKVIATTRNDSKVVKRFPQSLAKQLHINTSDPRNLEDIAFYIDRNLYPRMNFIDKIRSYLTLSSRDSSNTKLSDNLVKISQGNFLFAELLVKYIKFDSQISSRMPQSLEGVYERYFRRVFPTRESFKDIRGVLEILVASTKPFRMDKIFKTIKLQSPDLDYMYFSKDLESLSYFLRYSRDNKISLFHKSLMEWLVSDENKSIYVVSKKAGHRKLILYYMDAIKNKQTADLEEAVLSLAQHIAFGDSVEKDQKEFISISSKIIQNFTGFNRDKSSFLHLAARIDNPEVIKLFLPCFRDNVDRTDSNGFTPAFVSSRSGFLRNLKILVDHGANISHKTNLPPRPALVNFEDPVITAKWELWNSSMLHAAAQGGHLSIVAYLLESHPNIDDANGVGMTALQLAAENGHLEIVKLLNQKGAKIDQFALYQAAMNGHKDVVEFLISKNVTQNCLRCDGSFYWLGGKSRYQSLWFDVAKRFSSAKSRIDAILYYYLNYSLIDDLSFLYCETPLHISVQKRYTDVARILISRIGSAIHCADVTGSTPLHIAARNNDLELIKMLIEAGARVDSKCSRFLHQEQAISRSLSLCIKKRIHPILRDKDTLYSMAIETCSCGHTPVHVAAQFGHIESAQLLLQQNENLSIEADCDGSSLIHIAACHGKHDFIQWLTNHVQNVHINSPNAKNGSTPLHSAVACENVKEAKALIKDGANVSALDANDLTIVHYWILNAPVNVFCYEQLFLPSEKDIYFQNENMNVSISSDKTLFVLQYADQELKQEFVKIDDNCRDFMELLSDINDPSLFVVKDKFGRTPLHMSINSGLRCVSIVLMNIMPDQVLEEELGYSIWDYIFNDLVYKEDKCRPRNTIKAMFSFFDVFFSEKQHGDFVFGVKFSTLKKIFRTYLKKGKTIKSVERWLLDKAIPVTIECNVPFLKSELHLLAYWPPANDFDNFLFTTIDGSTRIPGPLAKAVTNHPLGISIINRCRDQEGYTALHRAAQGGNRIAIKEFLSWGADTKARTRDTNLTALDLAVSFAGLPKSTLEAFGFHLFTDQLSTVNLKTALYNSASSTSLLLLDRTPNVKVTCDGSSKQLTIYHIAAYRGMFDFVEELLKNSKRYGITEMDCPDRNGITPLYLAKLRVVEKSSDTEEVVSTADRWMKTVKLIERRGCKVRYPLSLEVEHHVLYRHLFGSCYQFDFNADVFKDLLQLYGHGAINTCYNEKKIDSFSVNEYFNSILEMITLPIISPFLSKKDAIDYYSSQVKAGTGASQEKLSQCDDTKLCSRFNHLLKVAILCFQKETVGARTKGRSSFCRAHFQLRSAKFTKFRLKFTPIFHLHTTRFTGKYHRKTLAVGMRYLLDIVLNKTTKYDYLRKLSLGISPDTRLFYDNTTIDDSASRKSKAMIKGTNEMFDEILDNLWSLLAIGDDRITVAFFDSWTKWQEDPNWKKNRADYE